MDDFRMEHDSFGDIAVPAARLWGAQTRRSLQHFEISNERMPRELLRALAQVKRAAAGINGALRRLDATKADAIVRAADEALAAHDAVVHAHGALEGSLWRRAMSTARSSPPGCAPWRWRVRADADAMRRQALPRVLV